MRHNHCTGCPRSRHMLSIGARDTCTPRYTCTDPRALDAYPTREPLVVITERYVGHTDDVPGWCPKARET